MRLLVVLIFAIPLSAFSQKVTKYKSIPKLETELKTVFVNSSKKHVNITDSLIKWLPNAFKKSTNSDTVKRIDSNFYTAKYTNRRGIFRFYFKTVDSYNPNEIIFINNRTITLSITYNDSLLLEPMQCYATETVESYAEETHCFLIDEENNGFPDILYVRYAFREYIDNDKFDCKVCKLFQHNPEGYDELEIVNCKEFLSEYGVPFILK